MHHNHNEQNLQEGDLNIKIQLRNNPLFLKKVQSVYEVAEIMLPYDTGIELECFKGKKFDIENFQKIPDIKDVNVDDGEQRFRIPNSLEGFICLYNLCETLKENSVPEIGSGLHYHIDFTNYFDKVNQEFIDKVKEYQKGKKGLIGLFVGEVKKRSKGKADPKIVTELLEQKLNA